MKFILPLPLSVNATYGVTNKGRNGKARMYKTQLARDWEDAAMQQIIIQKGRQAKPKGDTVYVMFYRKDFRRWDSNNALKILYDVLVKKQIIRDDSDLRFEQIQKIQSDKNYCVIEIL